MRSPFGRVRQELEAAARRAASGPEDQARGSAGASSGALAGGSDADSGEWRAYGLLGYTELGSGFRLSGQLRE